MTLYNTIIDLVNDNVYSKFGLNRSIRFQAIQQKLNYAGMTEKQREWQNDGQGKSSIAPLFSKRGFNNNGAVQDAVSPYYIIYYIVPLQDSNKTL